MMTAMSFRAAWALVPAVTVACGCESTTTPSLTPGATAALTKRTAGPASSASGEAPRSPSAASTKPDPPSSRAPIELRVGNQAVEISFKPDSDGLVKALHDAAHDADIATPALKKAGVGRGGDLVLVSHAQQEKRAYALFAAVTRGSPECGSYGFWALRVDAKGVELTPVIEGCFLSAGEDHPKITWSNPALLVVESPQYQSGATVEVFALDEQSFVFRSRVQAKVPD